MNLNVPSTLVGVKSLSMSNLGFCMYNWTSFATFSCGKRVAVDACSELDVPFCKNVNNYLFFFGGSTSTCS